MKNYTLALLQKDPMAASKNLVTGLLVLVVVAAFVYLVDPTMFGLLKLKQGFSNSMMDGSSCPPGKYMTSSGTCEGFEDLQNAVSNGTNLSGGMGAGSPDVENTYGNPNTVGGDRRKEESQATASEGFGDLGSMEGPADFGSSGAPAGCYPRDQLTPSELLPKDQNSVWAEQNPMGPGSLKGKNFLSAGALIGVNTVGQSLRNANYQLRSEPPNPQIPVSIFNQSTIAPDTNRRPLEIN